jgi:hypothetical protein
MMQVLYGVECKSDKYSRVWLYTDDFSDKVNMLHIDFTNEDKETVGDILKMLEKKNGKV